MLKKPWVAFLLGWLLSLLFSPRSFLGVAKGATSGAA